MNATLSAQPGTGNPEPQNRTHIVIEASELDNDGFATRASIWESPTPREGRPKHAIFASRADNPVGDCKYYARANGLIIDAIRWV